MTTEARVKLLINRQNLTQKKFAQSIGISPARLNNYFAGIAHIPSDLLVKIAQLYNVDLNWLMNGPGSDPIYNEPARARGAEPRVSIPVVADIAAGTGIDAFDVEPDEIIEIAARLLKGTRKHVAFRVCGDSMAPYILQDDLAVISLDWYDLPLDGMICAIRTVNGLVLKRFTLDSRGRIASLVPLNPAHPIISLDDNGPPYTMIGILVLVIRTYL